MINIYTDGACKGNPGPGGWGVAVYQDGVLVDELYEGERETTNNRMELLAFIAALEYIEDTNSLDRDAIIIHIDSKYVIKGTTEWLDGWISKCYKGVKNEDLWRHISLLENVWSNVDIVHVKGHSGNVGNDKADQLANIGVSAYL